MQFNNETLSLNDDGSIELNAEATVAKIGNVKFTGSMESMGGESDSSLTATASITVAGFTIPGATLTYQSTAGGADPSSLAVSFLPSALGNFPISIPSDYPGRTKPLHLAARTARAATGQSPAT